MDEFVYILKRIIQMIPVLIIVTVLIFFGMRMIPGDPALLMLGNRASDEALAMMHAKLGFDKPLMIQYLLFLKDCVLFRFGDSITLRMPITELFKQKAAITLSLTAMTILFDVLISVPLGIYCGMHKDSKLDTFLNSVSLVFVSIPEFLTGLVLLMLLAVKIHAFPVGGWGNTFGEHIRSLILPSLTGALMTSSLVMRNIRENVIKVLNMDYVDFARSKGLPEIWVRMRYVLRNVLIPAVTLLAMRMTAMLAGSIVIESIFALPGIGQMMLNAILARDYPLVQATVYLFALIVMIMNLITDVSYSILDPRVKL